MQSAKCIEATQYGAHLSPASALTASKNGEGSGVLRRTPHS